MDRLEISGAVPADDAERLSDIADTRRVEPTERDLNLARADCTWDVLLGKTVGGMDRLACLEAELNRDETGMAFVRGLDALFAKLHGEKTQKSDFWLETHEYLFGVIASHISAETVEERAYQTLNEREEA